MCLLAPSSPGVLPRPRPGSVEPVPTTKFEMAMDTDPSFRLFRLGPLLHLAAQPDWEVRLRRICDSLGPEFLTELCATLHGRNASSSADPAGRETWAIQSEVIEAYLTTAAKPGYYFSITELRVVAGHLGLHLIVCRPPLSAEPDAWCSISESGFGFGDPRVLLLRGESERGHFERLLPSEGDMPPSGPGFEP